MGFEPTTAGLEGNKAQPVKRDTLRRYFDRLELTGISTEWFNRCKRVVLDYLEAVDYHPAQDATLQYLKRLRESHEVSGYRKMFFQIRKFLQHIGADWAHTLQAPKVRNNNSIEIYRPADIRKAYRELKEQASWTRRYAALLLLGATSGLRAEELYGLRREDIDMERRIIYVRKSKTGVARHAFFNDEARRELEAYFAEEESYTPLFAESTSQKHFRQIDLRVKHLRKFFSQEWDRSGGNYNIKQLIMGRSVQSNVDLKHYAAQGVDDLRKAYDDVRVHVFG